MTEPPAASAPFTHEIRVTWGDCDPAQIAYTGRIPWWALDAINAWWEAHLGGDGWYQMELDRGYGTPFVHMSLDFRSPITPRHRLMCTVCPTKLGSRSITFRVEGHQNDTLCFEGVFVSVFVISGTMTSREAPPDIREIVTPLLRA